MSSSLTTWGITATLVVHVGIAAAVSRIEATPERREPTRITISSKAPPPKKVVVPPPPAPEPAKVAAVAAPAPVEAPRPVKAPKAPAPKAVAAAPAPSTPAAPAAPSGPPSYGVKMGNGGDGAALPAGSGGGERETAAPVPKALAPVGGCSDPIVKPKPISVVQPAFTPEAQEAGIAGKVRVEITISSTGAVTNARVIEGLGYGLDEAALAAAKTSTFSPATKCGEAVETTFTIGMRFQH